MKKELVNLQVVKGTASRGSRKGQEYKYVVAELKSVGNNWLASNTTRVDRLFILNPTLVQIFEAFVCKKNGGTAEGDENIQLPDDYRVVSNIFRVKVPLAERYVRINSEDQKDEHGVIIAKKGEPVKTITGDVAVYDSIEVLAVKVQDEDTGEMYWVDTPESIARRVLSRYYRRLAAAEEPAQTIGLVAGANEDPVDEGAEDDIMAQIEKLQAQKAEMEKKRLEGAQQ